MKFEKLVEEVLQENSVMGGTSSVMGSNVGATATAFSGDNWNTGDNRIGKSLYGGMITRRGMSKKTKKKSKKKK